MVPLMVWGEWWAFPCRQGAPFQGACVVSGKPTSGASLEEWEGCEGCSVGGRWEEAWAGWGAKGVDYWEC